MTGTASMPRSPIIETVAAGMKGSHGFLQRLFSRQTSRPALSTMNSEDEVNHMPLADPTKLAHDDLKALPCPYIRPLQNRLEPRMENIQKSHHRLVANSAKPTLRKKMELVHAAHNDPYLETAGESSEDDPAAMASMEIRRRQLREEIAFAATADVSHLQEWRYYIKCYSEGCYNLSTPPGPPPMKSAFTFLPSTYPINEVERLATFESSSVWSGTDIIWSKSEAERARSLIKAANLRFDAPWGAISFFDTDMEIVQAERGYSRHFIPRPESIASHVLLTNEVMTVLDTEKDWRFAGNPLVVRQPKIRFFAGAPLLSANSEVIGVFAIFGPEPRMTFTARQRRELTTFSEMAMRDLTSLIDVDEEQNAQSLPLVQSNMPSSDRNSSSCSPDLTPAALRYHKSSHHRRVKSRVIISPSTLNTCSNFLAHSPPNSDYTHGELSISTNINNFGEESEQFLLNSASALSNRLPDTPESPIFGNLPLDYNHMSSESFSISNVALDLPYQSYPRAGMGAEIERSSLFAETNRSTVYSSSILTTTLEPADKPGDGAMVPSTDPLTQNNETDCLSDMYPFEFDYEWPVPPKHEIMRSCAPTAHNHIEDAAGIENTRAQNSNVTVSSLTASKISHKEQAPADAIAEANFAAEFWAKHLGFDTIYAVELIPDRFFMVEDELKVPGAIEARIMVSYGLQELITFDIPMHLDVLRAKGAMTWENSHGSSKEYSIGFMMPLKVNPSMLEFRSIGVVFGAFRKTTEDFKQRARMSSAEIKRLQQAARVLKNILQKSVPVETSSSRETAFPPTPTPKGCSINGTDDEGRSLFNGSFEHLSMKRKPSRHSTRKS